MEKLDTRDIILNQGSAEEKRAEILTYFRDTFHLDSRLYDHLTCDDAFYARPEPLRHPLIFYLGHTACFYINKLNIGKLSETRINPLYESIFSIGVDEMSWDDLNEDHYDWPSVEEVRHYRDQVFEFMEQQIRTTPLEMPISWNSPFWVILMGIEHQRIHIETSSVIIRRLPIDQVTPLAEWKLCPQSAAPPENSLLPVTGGTVSLGKQRDHHLYGWDNEYGRQQTEVWDFTASQYLVSNREFLSFVEDNGYTREEYWTREGWNWRQYTKATEPLFWITNEGEYKLRTMAHIIDMPWDWPVEVNYLEAKAFCNWLAAQTKSSLRLPTEAEFHRLLDLHTPPDQPYWETAPGNINLEHWASSCPVNTFSFGDFADIIGNVWQWTETPITGFTGFEVHPCYDDFSTPTFDTQHNLIKGGSWISTGNLATQECRYAFRRHFFQHAGFRYVVSEQPLEKPQAMYENDDMVCQYCEAHYGDIYFNVPNFPQQCAEICLEYMQDRPRRRALDLGCSVGRTSFELSRAFDLVHGLDFSARFIRIAYQMQEKGVIRFELREEGNIFSYHEHKLSDLHIEGQGKNIDFYQADAANLKPHFSDYDLIFAGNLLDRMVHPEKLLTTIHTRLSSKGLLVLASPYTWLEEFTPEENWLGGYRKDGEPQMSLDGIKTLLAPHFTLVDTPRDVEFVIRETSRKFQHTVSQLSVWQRIE